MQKWENYNTTATKKVRDLQKKIRDQLLECNLILGDLQRKLPGEA